MLILRLRQAECAMADGRLDEAFDIAQSQDIRQHWRGQKLIGKLALAFAKRGQENLTVMRLQQALTDCNKAEKLAGNLPQVAQLRTAICKAIERKRYEEQQQALRLSQARERIENGWISVGEKILADAVDGDGRADVLRQQVTVVRLTIDEVVAKVGQALQRNDLEAAIDILRSTCLRGNHNNSLAELLSTVTALAAERIRENLSNGRIDLAQALHRRVAPIAQQCSEISELAVAVSHCRRAAESVAAGRPRQALALLRKVGAICPSAKWLGTAAQQTKQAAALREELLDGPLGLSISAVTGDDEQSDIPPEQSGISSDSSFRLSSVVHRPTRHEGRVTRDVAQRPSLPSKLLLQIDGVGSFLVLRDRRITVGPISSSARPTVGLIADPYLPVVTFERVEDDYFVRSSDKVQVNDKPTSEKLLCDGDRIALSPRCAMKFNIPNPASTTAVITLSSARISCADVRRVILMDRDILVGPTLKSHVPTELLNSTATLSIQNGRLLCRAEETVTVDGHRFNSQVGLGFPNAKNAFGVPLAMNKQVRIGPISLILTEFKE